ncbi:hypothetical protein PIB30_047028 [Stylosanthes scabra]|uniref:Uncharacterized protein n=1 Tax=Stylosanthes scabra TaxID=79078 RepID=A0ABU6QGV8_9FABA|nr:hypothetical protein [Stylosanthes scabra]
MEGLILGFQERVITPFLLLLTFSPFYSSMYIRFRIRNCYEMSRVFQSFEREQQSIQELIFRVASLGGGGSIGAKWVNLVQYSCKAEERFPASIRGVSKCDRNIN